MKQIAVGVTVFERINKLEALLDSINGNFASVVYVSDDGEWSKRKEEVYSKSYPFDLKVFDLEYDAGVGAGRNKIVQEMTEDYLLLMDSDMQMPQNVGLLLKQLEADPDLGGVCGLLAEESRIFAGGCTDFQIIDNTLNFELQANKEIRWVAGHPLVEFEMIANACLFRYRCLKDYNWDPNIKLFREHADFYLTHKYVGNKKWKFGLSPSVIFKHIPGGNAEYLENRRSESKEAVANEYFSAKWNLNRKTAVKYTWLDTYNPNWGGFPYWSPIRRFKAVHTNHGWWTIFIKFINHLKRNRIESLK